MIHVLECSISHGCIWDCTWEVFIQSFFGVGLTKEQLNTYLCLWCGHGRVQ